MERPEIVNSIRRSWEFLERAGLAETFSYADPLPVDEKFRDLIFSPSSGHKEIYTYGLQNSHYNFLLFDHSFFQFSWNNDHDLRYAYYPNPHVAVPAELHKFRRYREMVKDSKIDEDEFSSLVQQMRFDGGIPIFRYEYSQQQYVPFSHPCAHFHIGVHGENRWAVSRIITPLSFTLLIAKHYYAAEWNEGVVTEGGVAKNRFEDEMSAERGNCRVISDEYFCNDERNTFHFG